MDLKAEVAKLVHYIKLTRLQIPPRKPPHKHVGAIIADSVLQIGHKYETQVAKRIISLREIYPQAVTVSDFLDLLQNVGAQELLGGWNGAKEHKRLYDHTKFFAGKGVNTFDELADWLQDEKNRDSLIKAGLGIGDPTADYYRVLVGLPDAVKVDSRVKEFLAEAGIDIKQYEYKELRAIVQLAAKQLGKRPIDLDGAIWNYQEKHKETEKKMNGVQKEEDLERLRFNDAYAYAKANGLGYINKSNINEVAKLPKRWADKDFRYAKKGLIIECFDRCLGPSWLTAYQSEHTPILQRRLAGYKSKAEAYGKTTEGKDFWKWFRQQQASTKAALTIQLSPAQWDQLDALAKDLGTDGPTLAKIWIVTHLH